MSTTFKLRSPLMRGAHQLQVDTNARLHAWGVAWQIAEDGAYGQQTKHAVESVCFGLGIPQSVVSRGITPGVQAKIHDPSHKLNKYEKQRFRAREQWRKRLKHRFAGNGATMAVAYAKKMAVLHIVEHPAGSNRGPYIDNWNRLVGTAPGPYAYWCGAFANSCLMAAGFKPEHFMAYCPYIEQTAKSKVHGWSWHSLDQARPGDLPLYSEGGIAGHVEILIDPHPYTTIGGNTSADASTGSQSNGGGVFLRHRDPHDPGFPVRGVARPPYAHPY